MNLLKKSILLLLLFSTISQANAQIGVRAGGNFATVNLSQELAGEVDYKWTPGYVAGFIFEIKTGENFSIAPELNATSKGYKVFYSNMSNGELSQVEGAVKFTYLDVPVNLKKYISVAGKRIYVQAGPYAGFGISGKSKSKLTEGAEVTEETETIDWENNNINRLDYGANGGVGIQLNKLQVGLNYQHGIRDLFERNGNGGEKVTHQGASLTAVWFLK